MKEEYGTHAVLDIFPQYEVALTSPSTGAVYYAGAPMSIEWSLDDVDQRAATCDVFYRPDGAAVWEEVLTDASTTAGDCEWTPSFSHMSSTGELKVVFTTADGLEVPGVIDGTFSIIESPVFVDRFLNDQMQDQIPYQKLPYSSVSINFDDSLGDAGTAVVRLKDAFLIPSSLRSQFS